MGSKLYIGDYFEIKEKVITINAIEKEIDKSLKKYKGKKVLLTLSNFISSLCNANNGYDEKGFDVFKIQVDDKLKDEEFILTDLEIK